MLESKRGVVLGVANHRSLAWAIAKAANDAGAHVAITYQNDRLADNARKLAAELRNGRAVECDLSSDEAIDGLRSHLESEFGQLDFIVHGVAYALREELDGRFLDTSREGFRVALDISAYTFVAAAQRLEPLLNEGASLLTLSYIGGERVFPNYNVMGVAKAALESCVRYMANDLGPRGIRVNALSPGPANTLAARGIAGFTDILSHVRDRAPLHRTIEHEDVANAALYFLSDLSRNVTGQVLCVDGGYNIMGM